MGNVEVPDLKALMPTSDLAKVAWVDCLRWAIKETSMLAQFAAETKSTWNPAKTPTTPIERMIEEATGIDTALSVEFIRWFNRNFWGEVNGRAANGYEPELDADAAPGGSR